ncbi:MAG: DMT family transporter [Melioribacteraceae bacterium]|jgi:drug/metabolite transporter (DMT)-like permease|nr:DMT family transporter [Melioribacteraceae bacterium]MCO6473734.1 DMT family transporter [Melioribacteraceae bacterium]
MENNFVQPGFFHKDRKLSPYTVFGLMLIYTFVAAICYTAIKLGLEYSSPLRFAGLRTLIGGVSLIALLIILKKPILIRRDLIKWVLPVGFVSTTITFGFMFSSPEFTGAGIASVLGNSQPLTIIVLAALFLNEKITLVKITALILGMAGIILISAQAFMNENPYAFIGAMLATGTSLGAAITAILLKKIKPGTDLISFTGWQLIAGGLPLFASSFLFESESSINWSGTFLGLVIFLGIIGTALTEIIWFWLLQKYDASKLSLYLFLIPVFGLIFAFIAFGETLQVFEISGIIVVLSAIGLSVINEFKNKLSK